jgi:hypothetical protein
MPRSILSMRIEYDLTAEDWADFGEYCARTAPEFRRAIHGGITSGVLTIVVVSGLLWLKTSSLGLVLVGAVTAVAWGLFWPRRLVSHVRAHMRKRQLQCLTGLHILEATPEALLAKCDVTESTTRWAGIDHVAETARHVFVMLSDVQGYVIPKARIRGGDLDQFAREAQSYASALARRGEID